MGQVWQRWDLQPAPGGQSTGQKISEERMVWDDDSSRTDSRKAEDCADKRSTGGVAEQPTRRMLFLIFKLGDAPEITLTLSKEVTKLLSTLG